MRAKMGIGLTIGALVLLPVAALGDLGNNDNPALLYGQRMCFPLASNSTWRDELSTEYSAFALAGSPYPCEQASYFAVACQPNGTQEIDFLAEQQCLCPSSLWTLLKACKDCYSVHGLQTASPAAVTSSISELSAALCTQTPATEPYWSLVLSQLDASVSYERPMTFGDDKFPNNTAVSNYFTPTGTGGWTLAEITGSATARATTFMPAGLISGTTYNILMPETTLQPTATVTVTIPGGQNKTSSRAPTSGTNAGLANNPTPSNSASVAIIGRIVHGNLFIQLLGLCLVYASTFA